MRASGTCCPNSSGEPGITVLAPTDDAFAAKFSEDNLDEMMIKDKDTLRTMLRAHIVDRALTLRDLPTPAPSPPSTAPPSRSPARTRWPGSATRPRPCAPTTGSPTAAIHVINHVLGNLPTTAGEGDHQADSRSRIARRTPPTK